MSILYVFSVNDPENVGAFPLNTHSTEWFKSLTDYWNTNCLFNWGPESKKAIILFPDQASLTAYTSQYTLTDPDILADINTWKNTHNISYKTSYYNLEDLSIPVAPIVS